MKKKLKQILCGSLLLLLPLSNLHAENGDSGVSFFSENNTTNTNPGGHDPGDDPVSAPIDSYTIFLLLTAVFVAYYGRNNLVKIAKK